MAIVKWLPDALDDLKRLHEFIEKYSPVAASRAIDALIESTESLTEFPEIGRPWELEPDYRELLVKYGARGYVIRYRLIEDKAFIVRVWHSLENR